MSVDDDAPFFTAITTIYIEYKAHVAECGQRLLGRILRGEIFKEPLTLQIADECLESPWLRLRNGRHKAILLVSPNSEAYFEDYGMGELQSETIWSSLAAKALARDIEEWLTVQNVDLLEPWKAFLAQFPATTISTTVRSADEAIQTNTGRMDPLRQIKKVATDQIPVVDVTIHHPKALCLLQWLSAETAVMATALCYMTEGPEKLTISLTGLGYKTFCTELGLAQDVAIMAAFRSYPRPGGADDLLHLADELRAMAAEAANENEED